MDGRCRVCTANDREGLIEQVADDLWESRRHGSPEDRPFAEAGGYWRTIYLELAETAVQSIAGNHGAR